MWNYEAILKETNDRLKPLGKEPLYAIYPADGVAVADSPIGFLDHGRGPEVEKFFTDLSPSCNRPTRASASPPPAGAFRWATPRSRQCPSPTGTSTRADW